MALHAHGAALACCSEALDLMPTAEGCLLRARAHMMRRERVEAKQDVARAVELDEGVQDQAQALLQEMKEMAAQDKAADAQIYKRMLQPKK